MRIILTETVENLGAPGEVKEVANGYARNFLFPRNMAIPATKGALQEAANRKASAEKRATAQVTAAQRATDALQDLTVLLYGRTGEQNRLYGSITPGDVAEALRVQHHQNVDRRRIKIDQQIHRTGNYTATISTGHNLSAQIKLAVEPEASRTGKLTSVARQAPAAAAPPAPAVPEVESAAPAGAGEAALTTTAPGEALAASAGLSDAAPAATPAPVGLSEAALTTTTSGEALATPGVPIAAGLAPPPAALEAAPVPPGLPAEAVLAPAPAEAAPEAPVIPVESVIVTPGATMPAPPAGELAGGFESIPATAELGVVGDLPALPDTAATGALPSTTEAEAADARPLMPEAEAAGARAAEHAAAPFGTAPPYGANETLTFTPADVAGAPDVTPAASTENAAPPVDVAQD